MRGQSSDRDERLRNMALSLADELAAFDDAQGGGMSLAEEFGLDMGDETQDGECFDVRDLSRLRSLC